MDAWVWILIAVAVVVIVLIVAGMAATTRRRRSHLRDRFGPEYDRTVDAGKRRAAERDLREREQEHDQLELRPLSPASRAISRTGRRCSRSSSTASRWRSPRPTRW